jgi:hypothetical protein
MTNKVKFEQVSRVICPKTGIHYLDAVDENGQHWMAEMSHKEEPWLCFTETWKKDLQVPYDLMTKNKQLIKDGE